ncbi:MAG TPA: hypothetical protein PLN61_02870 [bacterium]|nr:hypothetical protein [bacterium]HQI47582.1 hypothetical protein [bacterium]HQJ64360.1 hypothetical protein [bacterium]HQJ65472.1 hypothetical protein [bacterium]
MMEELVPLGAFAMVVLMVKILSDNKLKRQMIEKGVTAEILQALFAQPVRENAPTSLKWGLVLSGVGLGALVGTIYGDGQDIFTLASMLLFGGLALIIFYFLAARKAG